MGRTACTEPQCLYKGDLYHFSYSYPLRACTEHCPISSNLITELCISFAGNNTESWYISGRGDADDPTNLNCPSKYSYVYSTKCIVTQFILSGNCSTCFGWYHPKHVEQFPDKLRNVASCWTYIRIPNVQVFKEV